MQKKIEVVLTKREKDALKESIHHSLEGIKRAIKAGNVPNHEQRRMSLWASTLDDVAIKLVGAS